MSNEISKTINLPYDIVLELGPPNPDQPGTYLGGTIKGLNDSATEDNAPLQTAVAAIEEFILALAWAGVDVETPAFAEALGAVTDKLVKEWGYSHEPSLDDPSAQRFLSFDV